MHFQRDFANALFAHEAEGLVPVRKQHFLPLVFEDVKVVGRPGTRHPVRLLVSGCAAATSAKRGDDIDAEFVGEANVLGESCIMCGGKAFVWVNWVAVAGQSRNLKSARGNASEELLDFSVAGEEIVDRTMIRPGISPRPNFNGLNTQTGQVVESGLQRLGTQNDGKNTYFHKRNGTLRD